MADYDQLVTAHYDQVAETFGASPQSTMSDEIIRDKETAAIRSFVAAAVRKLAPRDGNALSIADVGCGNGYTVAELARLFPGHGCTGVEYNDKLRELAKARTAAKNVQILPGDLRDTGSIAIRPETVDVLVCQRVLINLMDAADQQKGLDTIVRLVRPGGLLLFIEVFQSGIERLNEARAEFGLSAIPPAVHNVPLPDAFFDHPKLKPCRIEGIGISENMFSTHYFVSRVLHDLALKAAGSAEFKRNSHFVKFMSAALPDGVGDYSPLRVKLFERAR